MTEISQQVLETVARIDGSIVIDREGNLLAFGAILRHSPVAVARMKLWRASHGCGTRGLAFWNVLLVSEDGRLSF